MEHLLHRIAIGVMQWMTKEIKEMRNFIKCIIKKDRLERHPGFMLVLSLWILIFAPLVLADANAKPSTVVLHEKNRGASLESFAAILNDKNKVEIVFDFSEPVSLPKAFSLEDPPSIALDFPGVRNKIDKSLIEKILEIDVFKGLNVLESTEKTRVVVNLKKSSSFSISSFKNKIKITLDNNGLSGQSPDKKSNKNKYSVKSFDFHRGDQGEGRLAIDLSRPEALVDVEESKDHARISFMNASVSEKLIKQYDVLDFATPIKGIIIAQDDAGVYFDLVITGEYNKIAYQLGNQFIFEARRKEPNNKTRSSVANNGYNGNLISLNFQDIEMRAVLQVIADFAKFNVIASDNVKGNITLRLENLPWDQALDIILKTKNLDKRQVGNVMIVGSSEEIAAREKVE